MGRKIFLVFFLFYMALSGVTAALAWKGVPTELLLPVLYINIFALFVAILAGCYYLYERNPRRLHAWLRLRQLKRDGRFATYKRF